MKIISAVLTALLCVGLTASPLSLSDEILSNSNMGLSAYADENVTSELSQVVMNSSFSCTSSTVTVSWNAVEGSSGYEVRCIDLDTSEVFSNTLTSSTTVTIKKLSAGKKYSLVARAFRINNSVKEYSEESIAKTVATAPATVNVYEIFTDVNSITAYWTSQECSAYDVVLYLGSKKIETKTVSSDENNVTFKNLQKHKNYTLSVRAKTTADGKNVPGAWVKKTAITTYIKVAENLKTTTNTGSIKLSWSDSDNSDYYAVYKYDTTTKKWKRVKTTNNKYYFDTNLTSSLKYKYKIRKIKKVGSKTVSSITRTINCTTHSIPYTSTAERTKDLWIGDSRTVGMRNYEDINCIAKCGEGYNYLMDNFDTICSSKNTNIILNLGVNDLYNIDKYISAYNEIYNKTKRSCTVYMMAINPCDGSYSKLNSQINSFNLRLKNELNSNIVWVNTNYYMKTNGFTTVDGLHYSQSNYTSIYKYMLKKIHGSINY